MTGLATEGRGEATSPPLLLGAFRPGATFTYKGGTPERSALGFTHAKVRKANCSLDT
jgi:hypothetical protein